MAAPELQRTGPAVVPQERKPVNRAELDAAMAAARAPKSCRSCGRLFVGASAWTRHFESGPGSRCLPDHRLEGTLVQRDGAWVVAGSEADR